MKTSPMINPNDMDSKPIDGGKSKRRRMMGTLTVVSNTLTSTNPAAGSNPTPNVLLPSAKVQPKNPSEGTETTDLDIQDVGEFRNKETLFSHI